MIDPELLAKLKTLGIDPNGTNPESARELLRKLEALGINPNAQGTWVDTQPVEIKDLPTMKRQRQLMETIRDSLKTQLSEDLTKLDAAREELARRTHGGGR